jgi:hypothetical protein
MRLLMTISLVIIMVSPAYSQRGLVMKREQCLQLLFGKSYEKLKDHPKIKAIDSRMCLSILLKKLGGGGSSAGRCGSAYDSCVSECSTSIYDSESGDYIYNSDFRSKCESACDEGKSACENEDQKDDQCSSFESECESECPSSVYDYSKGEYLYSTDANSKCEDACSSGESSCS